MWKVANPFYEFYYRWYWLAFLAAIWKSRKIPLESYKYRIVGKLSR